MSHDETQSSNGAYDAKKERPPRVLFILAYPLAVLIQFGILGVRLGDFGLIFDFFMVGIMVFHSGLGALFIWEEATFSEFSKLPLAGGWAIWTIVVMAGLVRPTWWRLILVGLVTAANVVGCNLDHAWPRIAP